MSIDFSKAVTTRDGVVVGLGEIPEPHPLYKTDAFPIRVRFELTRTMQKMLRELYDRNGLHEIHRSTRSCLDQLGLFGGQHSSTKLNIQQTYAEMETLITCVDPQEDNRVLQALQSVWKKGRSQYCRLLLTPGESLVFEREMNVLTDKEIYYDYSQLPQGLLQGIWQGLPGRENIKHAKQERPMRKEVQPGEFFLAEMNGMQKHDSSLEHLWVLKRKVRRGDKHTRIPMRHGDACGFDPYRSTDRRQGEFFNHGDQPQSTDGLIVVAQEYRLDHDKSHRQQTKGT